MRTCFLLSALLLILAQPAFAQVRVGLKAGGNYTSASQPNSYWRINNKFKAGFHAGVLAYIPAGKGLFTKPELFYNVKGWKNPDPAGGGKINVEYLSMAFLLGVKATPKLSFMAGPEAGYLVAVGPKADNPQSPIVDKYDIVAYNRFEFGMSGGIAFQFHEKLIAEARYTKGFTDLFHSFSYTPPGSGGRNKAFQLSVNYLFGKAEN